MHCLRIACQDKDKGADSVNELLQRFGMEGDVFFAGGFLFVPGFDPVFPVLAGGAVFAEFQTGDFGVREFALVGRVGRKELDPGVGERGAGGAIKDVGFDFFAGFEREGDVAAEVEGLLESGLDVVVAGERGDPAFERFVFGSGS